MNIKIYGTVILPLVLYGCGSWSPILREERRLRVFENRVLRKIFASKKDEVIGGFENTTLQGASRFVLLTKYYSSDKIKKNEVGWACSTCGETGQVHTGFWWGDPKEGDHLGDTGLGVRILLKLIFLDVGWGHGLIWLRTGTSGGVL
jgi:hypothetical protein